MDFDDVASDRQLDLRVLRIVGEICFGFDGATMAAGFLTQVMDGGYCVCRMTWKRNRTTVRLCHHVDDA
jgi:hypothetical protein